MRIDLRTRRLVIRDIQANDALRMFAYRGNPAVSKYQTFKPESLQDVKTFIARSSSHFNVENEWFQAGIFFQEEMIGDIGIHFLGPQNTRCAIGYTIDPHFQRQGFGREAVSKVLDFLFETLGKSQVIASTDPENVGSQRLLETIGFKNISRTRGSIPYEDQWGDDLVYAMMRENWK